MALKAHRWRRVIPLTNLVFMMGLVSHLSAANADWARWRGPHDNGTAEEGNYPIKWSPTENLLWKTALPGKGCSSPIVWEKRIFITAPFNGEDAALAIDWSGKLLWQVKFGQERAGKHRNGSGSNPSPITDGRNLFVYFKSGNFAALTLDGKIVWRTNLVSAFGPDTLIWDHGASPVLTEKYVVMTRMHHGESWLAAFDKATGAMRWKVARNYETVYEGDNAYTTPVLIRHDGREALLLWGGEHVTAHDAADGKLLWTVGGFHEEAKSNWPMVATPVVVGDVAIVSFGRSDWGKPLLFGIKLGGKGDVTSTHRLWRRDDTGTYVPSVAEYKGRVYVLRDRGEVECLDPITGKTYWKDAFPKATANFYSSPVITGGKMYAIREDGKAFVAKVEDKLEILAENDLGENVVASPALLSDRLIIRGAQNLYSFGAR